MKKIIALLLVLALAFSMAACSKSSSKKSPSKSDKDKSSSADKDNDDSTDGSTGDTKAPGGSYGDESSTDESIGGASDTDKQPVDGENEQEDTNTGKDEDVKVEEQNKTTVIPVLPVNVKDLPAATIKTFNGNITKTSQVDSYPYTPERDGRYTFELSEVRAEIDLKMYVYDQLGKSIASNVYAKNGTYLTVDLKKGETYTCKVAQKNNVGTYVLSVGEQTETADISGFSAINDSVKFIKQQNNYTFVPQLDGRYTLAFSEVRAEIELSVYVYDRLGARVTYNNYAKNNTTVTLDLKGGEAYTFVVHQKDNFGSYTLNIGKQKATVDMTVGKAVKDSVEFTDQINIYTFTATDTNHNVELTEIGSGVELEIGVFNYLNEKVTSRKYCGNGTVINLSNLTAGQVYTVRVYQYNSFDGYTLTIK